MNKKERRKQAEEVVALVTQRKKKPRGRPFEKGNLVGFAGHPEHINPGGQPKIYQRADTMMTGRLLERAPLADIREAKLPMRKGGYSRIEVVLGVLERNAIRGDMSAIRMIREMYDNIQARAGSVHATQVNVQVAGQTTAISHPVVLEKIRLIQARIAGKLDSSVGDLRQQLANANLQLRDKDELITELRSQIATLQMPVAVDAKM